MSNLEIISSGKWTQLGNLQYKQKRKSFIINETLSVESIDLEQVDTTDRLIIVNV